VRNYWVFLCQLGNLKYELGVYKSMNEIIPQESVQQCVHGANTPNPILLVIVIIATIGLIVFILTKRAKPTQWP